MDEPKTEHNVTPIQPAFPKPDLQLKPVKAMPTSPTTAELRNLNNQFRDAQDNLKTVTVQRDQLLKELTHHNQLFAQQTAYFNATLSVVSETLQNLQHQIQLYRAQQEA